MAFWGARNAYGSLGDYEQQRSVTERGLKMQEQIYGVLSAWLKCFRCFLVSILFPMYPAATALFAKSI